MLTKEGQKKRDALIPNADLSDREIRQIRASAMGMPLREYERTLRHIGVDYSRS